MKGITFRFEHKDGRTCHIQISVFTTVMGFVRDVMRGVTWKDMQRIVIEWS